MHDRITLHIELADLLKGRVKGAEIRHHFDEIELILHLDPPLPEHAKLWHEMQLPEHGEANHIQPLESSKGFGLGTLIGSFLLGWWLGD